MMMTAVAHTKVVKKLVDILPAAWQRQLVKQCSESQMARYKSLEITGLQTDSRAVQPGNLFFAYPGASVDSRQFLADAIAAGAVCVIAETLTTEGNPRHWFEQAEVEVGSCLLLQFDEVQQHLGEMASAFYNHPSRQLEVIAVTGTNGKTSVTQMLAQAFDCMGKQARVIGTLGNGAIDRLQATQNTTPGALDVQCLFNEFLREGAEVVVMEASSHGLEQGRLNGSVVSTAVVTNFSRDHLDYHGSMEAYWSAKQTLVYWPGLQRLVLGIDTDVIANISQDVASAVTRIEFSVSNDDADIFAQEVCLQRSGIAFQLCNGVKSYPVNSSLIGDFNIANLLAVAAVLHAQHIDLEKIAAILAKIAPIRGRMQLVNDGDYGVKKAPTVVVDYAHTPEALAVALDSLRRHCSGELWVVFGCGGDRDQGKRPLMSRIASDKADHLILTTDNSRTENQQDIFQAMLPGITPKTDYQIIEDRQQAITKAIQAAANEDWILLAGKGHESYQDIAGKRYEFDELTIARNALQGCWQEDVS